MFGTEAHRVRSKPGMEGDNQKFRGFGLGTPSRAARELAEQRLEAEFEVAHLHDAVDGAGADFRRQSEDLRDERLKALDFL